MYRRLKAFFAKEYVRNEYDKITANIKRGLRLAKSEEEKQELIDFYMKLFRTEIAASSRINCFRSNWPYTIEALLPEKHCVKGKKRKIEYEPLCKEVFPITNETVIFTWKAVRLAFLFLDLRGKKWVEGPERESVCYKELNLLEVENGRHSATVYGTCTDNVSVTAYVVSVLPLLEEIDTDGIHWFHGTKKVDIVRDVRIAVLWELARMKYGIVR